MDGVSSVQISSSTEYVSRKHLPAYNFHISYMYHTLTALYSRTRQLLASNALSNKILLLLRAGQLFETYILSPYFQCVESLCS